MEITSPAFENLELDAFVARFVAGRLAKSFYDITLFGCDCSLSSQPARQTNPSACFARWTRRSSWWWALFCAELRHQVPSCTSLVRCLRAVNAKHWLNARHPTGLHIRFGAKQAVLSRDLIEHWIYCIAVFYWFNDIVWINLTDWYTTTSAPQKTKEWIN